jgi:hypothetical protein
MSLPLQHQIISRALDLIRVERNWTTVYVARAADGRPCACMDQRAVRFCAIGALARAANELTGASGEIGIAQAFAAEKLILRANNRSYDTLPTINDTDGHATIVAMFKAALEAN